MKGKVSMKLGTTVRGHDVPHSGDVIIADWQRILRAARYAHRRGLEENAMFLYHAGLQLADEQSVNREAVTKFLISEIWTVKAA